MGFNSAFKGLMGTWVPCWGVQKPGREFDHSPPSTAKVKNEWSYTFTPPYTFMGCTGKNLPITSVSLCVGTNENYNKYKTG